MELRDAPLERRVWRALLGAERVLGFRLARWLGTVAMRCGSRTERGFVKGAHRTVHPTATAPHLIRLPTSWWSSSPVVRARRLGLDLELDLRDNLQRCVYFTGTYEPALLRFLRQELRAGDVFVDVGAHIGVHSLTAAARLRDLGGGTVIAFEPAGQSAAKLRAAAAANGLDLMVVEEALGSQSCTAHLFADPTYGSDDGGCWSLYAEGPVIQAVSVVTFDAWARDAELEAVDVMKLDVEGCELDALRGMRLSLRRFRPRALVTEVKARLMRRAGVDEPALRDFLADCGYVSTGLVMPFGNELFRPIGTAVEPQP